MSEYKILSLDGGGIRGLMSAIWLNKLEDELKKTNPNKKLYEYFDLIVGTSTGSILACAVSSGKSATEIINLYKEKGKIIFPPNTSRLDYLISAIRQTTSPKYDGKYLEKELKNNFKQGNNYLKFEDLKTKTMIITYDTFRRQALALKTWKPEHGKLPVWAICKASSAAPTYFPAQEMQISQSTVSLIDGGVVANNPTIYAISEAIRLNNEKADGKINVSDFTVISLGTGRVTRRLEYADIKDWGIVEWALGTIKFPAPIIDVLFDSSVSAVDYASRQIIPDDKYFRFQTDLETAYDDMDDATQTNLNALSNLADDFISKNPSLIKQVIEALTVN